MQLVGSLHPGLLLVLFLLAAIVEPRVIQSGGEAGEFLIVPRGVDHKPVARETAQVVLFEPAGTRNTGDVDHELTIEAERLERM